MKHRMVGIMGSFPRRCRRWQTLHIPGNYRRDASVQLQAAVEVVYHLGDDDFIISAKESRAECSEMTLRGIMATTLTVFFFLVEKRMIFPFGCLCIIDPFCACMFCMYRIQTMVVNKQ